METREQLISPLDGINMARQAAIVKEMVERYYPEAIQTLEVAPDMAIPE